MYNLKYFISHFFWSYSIRLTLLQNDPQRPLNLTKCQLISRHWNIYEPPTLDDIKMALDSNQPIPEGNYERVSFYFLFILFSLKSN